MKPYLNNIGGPLISYGRPIICTACPCPESGRGKLPPRPSYQPPPPGAITTKCSICTSLHWDENDIPGVDTTPDSVFVTLPDIFLNGSGCAGGFPAFADCSTFAGTEFECIRGSGLDSCTYKANVECTVFHPPPSPPGSFSKTELSVSVSLGTGGGHMSCQIVLVMSITTEYGNDQYRHNWAYRDFSFPISSGRIDCERAFQVSNNKDFTLEASFATGFPYTAACLLNNTLPTMSTKRKFGVSL